MGEAPTGAGPGRRASPGPAPPSTLVITFSEPLDTAVAPEALAFEVHYGSAAKDVTNVAISGSKVTLTINDAATATDTVTVDYVNAGFTSRIRDVVGNVAKVFTTPLAVAWTTAPTIPTVSSVAITSTPPDTEVADDDTYAIGSTVEATVTFSEAVNVTGAPLVELAIANSQGVLHVFARYARGSGTAALVFSYTVVEDDVDTDGIAVGANKLVLNGGTVAAVSGGLAANLDHDAVDADAGHKVDGVRPTLESVKNFGQPYTVTLTYSEPLGALALPAAVGFTVKINGTDATISFVGTEATTLELLHVVLDSSVSEMSYGDTVTVSYDSTAANPVRDLAGNTAGGLTDQAVENQIPEPTAISSVALSSEPGTDNTYGVGDRIKVTVTFDRNVQLNLARLKPHLELDVGGTARQVEFSSGGDAELDFEYTVVAGDADADGVSIGENKLEDDAGAIGHFVIVEGVNTFVGANVDHEAVADDAGHKVDGVAPTLESAVVDTAVDDSALVLTFSEALDTGSTPAVGDVSVSDDGTDNPVTAVEVDGRTVTLTLTNAEAASATNVTVTYTAGTNPIQDVPGNDAANLSSETVTVKTGPTTPTVSSVAITSTPPDTAVPDDDTYAIGDEVEVTVTFSEAVNVTGTPYLTVIFADSQQSVAQTWAKYVRGAGTAALVFSRTVAENDEDPNGIHIPANSFILTGATITAVSGGLAANLAYEAVDADAGHKVDGVRPTLTTANVYGVDLTLEYDEDLDDSTAPPKTAFTVEVGGTEADDLTDVIVDGTEVSLELKKRVEHGDTVTLTYTPPASNPIRDLAGNAAVSLTDKTVTNNTPAPITVSSVALTSDPGTDATYAIGDMIEATVTFGAAVEIVTAGGTPQLELQVGDDARQAAYSSGSNSAALVFSYTVAAGDWDADGVSIGENKLDTNGGGFGAESGDAAVVLDHDLVPADAGHKVDGVAPLVDDAVIDVTSDDKALVLTWSEPLDADSAPDQAQFAVDFDGTDNAVTAVDIDGSTLTLTLTTAATATTANVTVDYTKPETDFLTDAPGNAADGFTGRAVTVKSGPPTVSIAADADSVNEGEAAAFTLSRTGPAAAALTVNVSVTQEGDFISGTKPTTVTFGAGDATVALEVATVDDDVAEDHGSITVTVTSVPSGIEISQTAASATVAVEDDGETWATVSSDRAAVRVNESAGTVTLRFSMRMAPNVTPFAMQVSASTEAGTALYDEDYETITDVVTFAATDFELENGRRVAHKTVDVTILNNPGRWEGDETFTFKLEKTPAHPPAVNFVDQNGNVVLEVITTVTIAENQARPSLSLVFDPPNVDEGETATLKAVSASGVAFALEQTIGLAFGGTATEGTDYTAGAQSLTLDAGKTSVATTVEVLSDMVDDEYETIVVTATHGTRTFTATLGIGAAVPEAPAKVEATGYNGHAKLAWTKPAWDGGTPILRYEYRVAPAGAWTYLGWPQLWMTADIQLEPGEYGFDVRAVNAVGPGPWTGPATARVWPAHERPEGAPSAPQNLAVTSVTDTRADLEWFRPASYGDAPIRGFRVETCVAGCESESTGLLREAPGRASLFRRHGAASPCSGARGSPRPRARTAA